MLAYLSLSTSWTEMRSINALIHAIMEGAVQFRCYLSIEAVVCGHRRSRAPFDHPVSPTT